ncbi:MAG: hypothetical protein J0H19_00245, partial [Rhodospirillales bacterium]|nr:hypothetical protein [Rhodospirillales bacterium]
LTSQTWDNALWLQEFPDEPYNPGEQTDNVPAPKKGVVSYVDNRRVIFDRDTLAYIKSDVEAGIDAQSLD